MIPFGDQTVTLYHRVRTEADGRTCEGWQRHVLTGCSWRYRRADDLKDGAVTGAAKAVCRIPAGQVCPAAGDVAVLGVCAAQPVSAKEAAAIADGADAFRVCDVTDNSRGPLPHYTARGE